MSLTNPKVWAVSWAGRYDNGTLVEELDCRLQSSMHPLMVELAEYERVRAALLEIYKGPHYSLPNSEVAAWVATVAGPVLYPNPQDEPSPYDKPSAEPSDKPIPHLNKLVPGCQCSGCMRLTQKSGDGQ